MNEDLAEFGGPEAVWRLQVQGFPTVVTIDTHGTRLHEQVSRHSQELLAAML